MSPRVEAWNHNLSIQYVPNNSKSLFPPRQERSKYNEENPSKRNHNTILIFLGFPHDTLVLISKNKMMKIQDDIKGLYPSSIYMKGKGAQQYKVGLNPHKQPTRHM